MLSLSTGRFVALALLTSLALAQQSPAPEGPKPEGDDQRGYTDTPQLPGQKWKVHDAARPRPPPNLSTHKHACDDMHPFIETQQEYLKEGLPEFRPGDTLRVSVRVREGEKERLQAFEGVCIARKNGGITETFTVRKISGGGGVERQENHHD